MGTEFVKKCTEKVGKRIENIEKGTEYWKRCLSHRKRYKKCWEGYSVQEGTENAARDTKNS